MKDWKNSLLLVVICDTIKTKFRDSSSKLIFGDHLLEILAKVLRTLLYSMNMPESETEDAVAKIKERKMGRLFENVTMDIQAERRKNAEVLEALEAAQREIEAAQRQIEEVQQAAQQEIKEAQQEVEIYRHISKMLRRDLSEAEIRESIVKNFGLTETQAADVLRRVLEE